jgi:cobalt-zinc-cadmium efflux system outer membrane protein
LEYNALQTGVFELLRAKQEEVNVGKEYVGSLRDYWAARAELEKAVGGSLLGSLSSSSSSSKSLDSVR